MDDAHCIIFDCIFPSFKFIPWNRLSLLIRGSRFFFKLQPIRVVPTRLTRRQNAYKLESQNQAQVYSFGRRGSRSVNAFMVQNPREVAAFCVRVKNDMLSFVLSYNLDGRVCSARISH